MTNLDNYAFDMIIWNYCLSPMLIETKSLSLCQCALCKPDESGSCIIIIPRTSEPWHSMAQGRCVILLHFRRSAAVGRSTKDIVLPYHVYLHFQEAPIASIQPFASLRACVGLNAVPGGYGPNVVTGSDVDNSHLPRLELAQPFCRA